MSADKTKCASAFFRRGLISLLCYVIIFSLLILNTSAVELSAKAAVLMDAESGEIIFEKNADMRLPMASTTKIMTAVVALERADLDEKVKISPAAVGVEGSSIYLCADEILTVRELLYALLLSSANDAATALAIHIGGGIGGFADMMNEFAAKLELNNSHFDNPHGLDSPGHYTTARDLAKLTAYALKNEEFKTIVSTYKIYIPFCGKKDGRLLVNHNKLLKSYDGVIGVKTGFTKKSGRCLVSAAQRDGACFIVVTLNAPDDWNDHRKLLDHGFENYECVKLEKTVISLPVICGVKTNISCGIIDEVNLLLPKDHSEIETKIEAYPFVYAPAKKNDIIGKVIYMCDGRIIAERELRALETVDFANQEYTIIDRLIDKIFDN